jgi:hypothetical protein
MNSVPKLEELIRFSLTDELRKPGYGSHPMSGFCYVASEAFYHIMGGKRAGFTPCTIKHEGVSHWYLKHKSGRIVDITVDQFKTVPDYSKGRGRGFLTKDPSKRAQIVIDRAKKSNYIAMDKVIGWVENVLTELTD